MGIFPNFINDSSGALGQPCARPFCCSFWVYLCLPPHKLPPKVFLWQCLALRRPPFRHWKPLILSVFARTCVFYLTTCSRDVVPGNVGEISPRNTSQPSLRFTV